MYPSKITGTNNIPLGSRKKKTDGDEPVQERGRPLSRWSTEKTVVRGLSTALPGNLSNSQIEKYLTLVRIDEIGRKFRDGNYVPRDKRSVSPEPIYDSDGKRLNTREYRYRKKFEDERHSLIEKASTLFPGYRAPPDYRKPQKNFDKVYIPIKDFPEVNFIGLLIGPRGSTLKKMEADSGTKIAIRGKGSVKEGRNRDGPYGSGEDDDLHCLIMADSEEKVKAGVDAVNRVIEMATSIPEAQNELKQKQLRQLAELNGTLRDWDDADAICNNCGNSGHKRWNCPEKRNFVTNLVCRICGGAGHIARDCTQKNGPGGPDADVNLESEYANMMAEIGAGSEPSTTSVLPPWQQSRNASPPSSAGGVAPPWASNSGSGSNAPWQRSSNATTYSAPKPAVSGGSAAPWNSSSGSHSYGNPGYGSQPSGGAPPPWSSGPSAYGPPGTSGHPPPPGYGAPPPGQGFPPQGVPPPPGAPGTSQWQSQQQYGQANQGYGNQRHPWQ